ncbi:MAG TPA: hypothetical protein VGF54_07590 [Streptosporangiaceae bacterium]|jgi:hypothetical protein
MPFCTIVEFEWDETFDRAGFSRVISGAGGETPFPDGLLSQISGIDEKGARVIEVWRSAGDARAFAEKSRPFLEAAKLPPPSRVAGFEVTSYVVS